MLSVLNKYNSRKQYYCPTKTYHLRFTLMIKYYSNVVKWITYLKMVKSKLQKSLTLETCEAVMNGTHFYVFLKIESFHQCGLNGELTKTYGRVI